jgi:hypothetical protein
VIGVVAAAITSLSFFIMIERRTYSALIDLKMLLDKILLPANIINMVIGITALMVVNQTIPILIRSPPPLGFGGNALSTAKVQLSYMAVSSSTTTVANITSLVPYCFSDDMRNF